MNYDLWVMIYELWCRDAAFIKLKIENWKLKNVFVFAVGTWRATFFWFLISDFWCRDAACHVFLFYAFVIRRTPFCHPDDRREEGSRQHPLHAALCYRDPSLRSGWHKAREAALFDLWLWIMNYGVGTWRATLIDVWCIMYDSWPLTLTIRMATHKS